MRFLLTCLAALLAGCATLPERSAVENPDTVWVQRQSALLAVTSWALRGRIALRRNDEGAQASLSWARSDDVHRLELAGPFGGGRVRITQDRDGAQLRDSSGNVYRDVSLSALLARATGWWLPLEAMRHWIVGLPTPAAPFDIELDAWGRPKTLDQLGWKIHYLDYVTEHGHDLPRRLFIERRSSLAAEEVLEARLVIERWSLGDPAPH